MAYVVVNIVELGEGIPITGGGVMTCPKCKARIGIMKDKVIVGTGAVDGVKCFICGFWVQTNYK